MKKIPASSAVSSVKSNSQGSEPKAGSTRRRRAKNCVATSFNGTPLKSPPLAARPRQDPDRRIIGLDLGDKSMCFRVVDGEGRVLEEGASTTSSTEIAVFAKRHPGAEVLMEAGGNSPWVQREFCKQGLKAVVTKADILCGRRRRKNDPTDAAELAELMRMNSNRIVEVEHKPEDVAVDFVLLKARDTLVKSRTAAINFVRGELKTFGVRIQPMDADCFGRRAAPHVPAELRRALKPMIDEIVGLTARIKSYEKNIKKAVATTYPQAKRFVDEVYGVSDVVALAFVLTIFNPERFRRARDVGPYLGLEPKERSSGTIKPQLGVSKAGNPFMRKLLVQSAHFLLGGFAVNEERSGDLREWGMSLKRRGGKAAKKRAAVAVARKLAVAMLASWKSETPWDPRYASKRKKTA